MTEPLTTGTARRRGPDRDIEIAYETFGPRSGEPLVLIAGTGPQRYLWDEEFCAALVERGFQVTRFDNRDTGASTRFDDAGRPNLLAMARVAGRATAAAIPGAVLRTFPGMGHDLPRELWGEITAAVAAVASPTGAIRAQDPNQ